MANPMQARVVPWWHRSLFVIAMCMLVSGCGAEALPKKLFKVITNPKIKIGEPTDLESAIKEAPASADEKALKEKLLEVIENPDVKLGDNKDQASTIDVTIYAESGANANMEGEHVPMDVWIFQLEEVDRFTASTYDELTVEPIKALGSHFKDVKDMQLDPGGSKVIKGIELKEDTNFIGVVGGYADLDYVDWLRFEKVKDFGEEYSSLIIMKPDEIFMELHR